MLESAAAFVTPCSKAFLDDSMTGLKAIALGSCCCAHSNLGSTRVQTYAQAV